MIARITDIKAAPLMVLVTASQQEGFGFVKRLCDEWASGTNVFGQPGEALYGVFVDSQLVGVGGINRQDEHTGRLRHFYILPSHRRRGLGRELVAHILNHARGRFRSLVLRTDTPAGDLFYQACGFAQIRGSDRVTHQIDLQRENLGSAPGTHSA